VTGGLTGTVDGVTGAVTGTVGSVVGGVTSNVVDPLLGALTPGSAPAGQAAPAGAPVTAVVDLGGTGTPGATVAVQGAGVLWATTTVGANGKWTVQIDALPTTVGALNVTQNVSLLGLLQIKLPLTLTTGPLGIVVNLLG
jgi:hypothetical protein